LNRTAFKQDFVEGRVDETRDHLHGCQFARAVRAEVAGDFAGARREGDNVDGGMPEKCLETLRISNMIFLFFRSRDGYRRFSTS
jgi:hypothetical protein